MVLLLSTCCFLVQCIVLDTPTLRHTLQCTTNVSLTGIPKLDDANDAGGRNSDQCTLILTEGDSAKALAISGLSVVGRDRYGVFPLRGKLLNVRDASASQVSNNAEIQHIKQILGLQHGKVRCWRGGSECVARYRQVHNAAQQYDSVKQLRYGHLMIMTDQDHDGSHIKGLIMNFFHHFYPSLLKLPGFLVEFITPIIKVTRNGKTLAFYTMPEYEAWQESLGGSTRGWKVKYYKGTTVDCYVGTVSLLCGPQVWEHPPPRRPRSTLQPLPTIARSLSGKV